MKRIMAACLEQTVHFLIKEDLPHEAAVRAVRAEYEHYQNQMRRNRTESRVLEELEQSSPAHDVDVLVLYDETVSVSTVTARVEALRAEGKTVSAQRSIPEKLRYAALCDLRKEETR